MTTPNLQLPEVPEATLDISDELNAGLWTIDALLNLAVLSRTVTAPPTTAQQGDRYIIPAGATGVWAGRANHIAYLGPLGWRYLIPRNGWLCWVMGETPRKLLVFDNLEWAQVTDETETSDQLSPRGGTWAIGSGAIETPVDDIRLYFPFACTIIGVVLMTGESAGNCVVDVRKAALGSYPPVTSICASAKPTITAGRTYLDTTLTGWTTAIAAGDVIGLSLESCETFRSVHCSLLLERA